MVQQLRAGTVLAEDPSSVLRTPIRQLTSDKGDLRPKGSVGTCGHMHIPTSKHTYT